MGIMQDLKAAGLREEDMDHHESDLYVKVNEISKPIIKKYRKEGHIVSSFISPIDRKLWYEIVGSYDPFWEEKRNIISKIKEAPIVAGVIERKDMARKRVLGIITENNNMDEKKYIEIIDEEGHWAGTAMVRDGEVECSANLDPKNDETYDLIEKQIEEGQTEGTAHGYSWYYQ